MDKRGVTLIELLVVIVVLGIVASTGVVVVGNIIRNTQEKVDAHNQQFLVDTLEGLFLDGTLEMQGNKVYSNETGKSYGGTGKSFYSGLEGYIANRIFPLVEEAQNSYNQTSDGLYRYRFREKDGDLEIYYFDDNKDVVVVATVNIP